MGRVQPAWLYVRDERQLLLGCAAHAAASRKRLKPPSAIGSILGREEAGTQTRVALP